jgi:glutamate racemase
MDPARPVARELARRLDGEGLRAEGEGAQRFWTSGDVMRVRPVIARLWGGDVDVEALPAAFCEDDQPELAG